MGGQESNLTTQTRQPPPALKSREPEDRELNMADTDAALDSGHGANPSDPTLASTATDSTPSPPSRLAGGLDRLTTPKASKADSIASQFQREILGELANTPQLRLDAAVGGTTTGEQGCVCVCECRG